MTTIPNLQKAEVVLFRKLALGKTSHLPSFSCIKISTFVPAAELNVNRTPFSIGDFVVYTMPKHSRHPGPRARSIHPAPAGDDYSYVVDKFWIVDAITEDGTIVLRTRRGKTHSIRRDDPLLRRANLWERWRHRNRFPERFPGGNSPVPNGPTSED